MYGYGYGYGYDHYHTHDHDHNHYHDSHAGDTMSRLIVTPTSDGEHYLQSILTLAIDPTLKEVVTMGRAPHDLMPMFNDLYDAYEHELRKNHVGIVGLEMAIANMGIGKLYDDLQPYISLIKVIRSSEYGDTDIFSMKENTKTTPDYRYPYTSESKNSIGYCVTPETNNQLTNLSRQTRLNKTYLTCMAMTIGILTFVEKSDKPYRQKRHDRLKEEYDYFKRQILIKIITTRLSNEPYEYLPDTGELKFKSMVGNGIHMKELQPPANESENSSTESQLVEQNETDNSINASSTVLPKVELKNSFNSTENSTKNVKNELCNEPETVKNGNNDISSQSSSTVLPLVELKNSSTVLPVDTYRLYYNRKMNSVKNNRQDSLKNTEMKQNSDIDMDNDIRCSKDISKDISNDMDNDIVYNNDINNIPYIKDKPEPAIALMDLSAPMNQSLQPDILKSIKTMLHDHYIRNTATPLQPSQEGIQWELDNIIAIFGMPKDTAELYLYRAIRELGWIKP